MNKLAIALGLILASGHVGATEIFFGDTEITDERIEQFCFRVRDQDPWIEAEICFDRETINEMKGCSFNRVGGHPTVRSCTDYFDVTTITVQ